MRLITALKKNAEPVQKITIVPRTMGSLGYVMQVPEEEKYLMTKDELHDKTGNTVVAGRAAEEVVFDTVTTGACKRYRKGYQDCQSHDNPVRYVRQIRADESGNR